MLAVTDSATPGGGGATRASAEPAEPAAPGRRGPVPLAAAEPRDARVAQEPGADATLLELERARAAGAREGDYLALFRELARRDPAALAARVDSVLLGGRAELAERVALLRALWESVSDAAGAAFEDALLGVPASASADEAGALRAFAVRFLGERCASDARAASWLEAALWPKDERALAPELRRRAAHRLAAALEPADLSRISGLLALESDRSVVGAWIAGAEASALAADPRWAEICRSHGFAAGDPPAREGDVP